MSRVDPDLESVTFFIVDDIQSIRNQMISDLRTIGCKGLIIEADSISKANESFMKQKIDFVICDWNLPDGTGIDFLRNFRKNKFLAKVPFVMCTTNDEVAHFLQAVQEGASDFIVKPWTKNDLVSKINSCWHFLHRS